MPVNNINVNEQNVLKISTDRISLYREDTLASGNCILNSQLIGDDDLFANPIYGMYLWYQGEERTDVKENIITTDYISDLNGKTIRIRTNSGSSLPTCHAYDSSKNWMYSLGHNTNSQTEEQLIYIPNGVTYIRLFTFTVNGDPVDFYGKVIDDYNLLDKFAIYGHYFGPDGNLREINIPWVVTDYINVEKYGRILQCIMYIGASNVPVAMYDKDFNFIAIKPAPIVPGEDGTVYKGEIVIDNEECFYIRIQSHFHMEEVVEGTYYKRPFARLYYTTNYSSDETEKIIVSATDSNAKYTTLKSLFENEPIGKKKIYLPDSEYTITTSTKLNILDGWEIYGRGIDVTTIKYTASDPNFNTNWLDVIGDSKMHDLTIHNIYPSDTNILNVGYCLHIDSAINNLTFECERVRLFTDTSNRNSQDTNGLVLGIGTWSTQKLMFKDCVFDTNVSYPGTGILNYHNANNDTSSPAKTIFENCYFGVSGSSIHILYRDIPNQVKEDLIVKNCVIKSFITYETFGTIYNSYNMNFSGSTFYGITGYDHIANSALSNYTEMSIPLCDQIDYVKNTSAQTITEGKVIKKQRSDRSGSWHYNEPGQVVMGIDVAGVGDKIDGVSLVEMSSNTMGHILNKGVILLKGYTFDNNISVGNYIKLSSNSNFSKSENMTNVIYLGDNFIELF